MFCYFGYGSNMNLTSLRAKGVKPVRSMKARLPGWKLRFNVEHFFRHEGGMGNIEPTDDPGDHVLGVVHYCDDDALARLDEVEAYGVGYDRTVVELETDEGRVEAWAYVGYPAFINNVCKPTQRYLNILVDGAKHADIDRSYVEWLASLETLQKRTYPQFVFPEQPNRQYTDSELTTDPPIVALAGAVFDLSEARPHHEYVKKWFGGKDVTLFHLQRMDSSDGTETMEDIVQNRLNSAQLAYLNEYLIEFSEEYEYVGRFSHC